MNKQYSIAVLITTFLRDNLLYKTLDKAIEKLPENAIILVADQGYCCNEKNITIDYYESTGKVIYYKIPFDSGLAFARNYLFSKAKEMNIPFCLLMADSIQFIPENTYDFTPFFEFLTQEDDRVLIGFELNNSKADWEYNMEIKNGVVELSPSHTIVEHNNISYKQIDICRNIFLCKTDLVQNMYDNELKLSEHEQGFLNLKSRDLKCFWSNNITFKRVTNSNPKEYSEYRKRFQYYQKIFKQKFNLSGWVKFVGVKREKK